VTQVREQGQRRANPYLEVLARPGALRFSAAAYLARTPMSMFGLGTLLLIASVTGQYGEAGFVAAAGSVGYAVCAPQAARLADRFGQGRVLRPLAVFFAVATIALIGCALGREPVWAMLIAGGLAGASMPSIGSMVRARWSALLGDSPLLHTAFALESVADETIFVIGPALVTVLCTEVYPAAGVAVAMVACVTGTLLFAAQRRTEPPAGRVRPPDAVGGAKASGPLLPAPGLATLAPVYFCLPSLGTSRWPGSCSVPTPWAAPWAGCCMDPGPGLPRPTAGSPSPCAWSLWAPRRSGPCQGSSCFPGSFSAPVWPSRRRSSRASA
jgi:MFS family permease